MSSVEFEIVSQGNLTENDAKSFDALLALVPGFENSPVNWVRQGRLIGAYEARIPVGLSLYYAPTHKYDMALGFIAALAVAPEYRGCGTGASLLRLTEHAIEAYGLQYCALDAATNLPDFDIDGWYEQFGYEPQEDDGYYNGHLKRLAL